MVWCLLLARINVCLCGHALAAHKRVFGRRNCQRCDCKAYNDRYSSAFRTF